MIAGRHGFYKMKVRIGKDKRMPYAVCTKCLYSVQTLLFSALYNLYVHILVREVERMLEIRSVVRHYGKFCAVNNASFICPDKKITGLLGVNGAGKTTLMNIITGCMPAGSGDILMDGLALREHPADCRRKIGYLPERPPLYDEMTVQDYLAFVCRLREVERADIPGHVRNILELCGLSDMSGRLLGHLSKGYRQRAGIAQALCGDPPILVLDEPTVGLDPRQVSEMRELIRRLGENHTILFSSHILSEVQALCSRIVIIHHGRILKEAELGEESRMLRLSVKGKTEEVMRALRDVPDCSKVRLLNEAESGFVECEMELKQDAGQDAEVKLFRLLAARDLPLRRLSPAGDSLETLFLRVTDEEGGSR